MQDGSAADPPVFSLLARRNCSLQPAGRWRAFAIVALVSALIASGFASVGAWPIVPFAGLELAALYVAFRRIARDLEDYELVTVSGDTLVVESHRRGRSYRFESNRLWTQLLVQREGGRCKLALRSQGRQIEFGTLLGEEARLAAARRLQDLLRIR